MKKSYLCLLLVAQLMLATNVHAGGTQPEEKKTGGWFSAPLALVASLFFVTDVEAGKVRVTPDGPSNVSKANATEAFMKQRAARGEACSDCFCDPCPVDTGPDCCADYNSCASAYNSLNSACASCVSDVNGCEYDLSNCNSAYSNCQYALAGAQSAQGQCQASLGATQQALAEKTALLVARTNRLNECEANLATSRNTLNAVGAVCTDLNGCRQEVLNDGAIQVALQEALPDLNVTSEMLQAVKGALQRGLDGGQCLAAGALCANRTFPSAVECPVPATVSVTCSSSAASVGAPSYTLMAGLIGGSIFLNHHEFITDVAQDTFNGIRSGVEQLRSALVGSAQSPSEE